MEFGWIGQIGVLVYFLTICALMVRVVFSQKSVGAVLAWLFLLFFIPILGISFYLLFGERYIGVKRARRAAAMYHFYQDWLKQLEQHSNVMPPDPAHESFPLWQLTYSSSRVPVFLGNELRLLSSPEQILREIEIAIKNANSTIIAEFYILEAGGRVDQILTELIKAKKRGVDIWLLLDSVGSRKFLKSRQCKNLKLEGIKIVEALHASIFKLWWRRIDIRMHRKILVVDGQLAFTGSMNLVDPALFRQKAGVGQWIDIMVKIKGSSAAVLQAVQVVDWEMETGERLLPLLKSRIASGGPGAPMQVVATGPSVSDENLLQLLLTVLYSARESISITTPYFVPDDTIVLALKGAALRGVKVKIFLPRRNDSRLAQLAGRAEYEGLMASGVEIHRFKAGLLHTKCVLVDKSTVLVGTVNLDVRSIWLNFELTAVVQCKKFCESVNQIIVEYENKSELLQSDIWLKRSIRRKVAEKFIRLLSPLL